MKKRPPDYQFVLHIPTGAVLRTSEVSEEPEVELTYWDIRTDTKGLSYFVGIRADDGWARVSTPIGAFDPERRRGRTHSGRTYKLTGPQGLTDKAKQLWQLMQVIRDIQDADA